MIQKITNFIFDRPGWHIGLIAFGLLLFSGVWAWKADQPAIVEKDVILKNPHEYAGTHVCMPYGKVVLIRADTAFTVTSRSEKYRFLVDTSIVRLNQTYSFAGELQADGTIIVTDVHHHTYRFAKYAFSLLSLPIIVWLILKYIRFDRSSLSFIVMQEDRHA